MRGDPSARLHSNIPKEGPSMSSAKGVLSLVNLIRREIESIFKNDVASKLTFYRLATKLRERIVDFAGSAEEFDELVKFAWNYEEKFCGEYSMEEAVGWFKANMPKTAAGACLLKAPRGTNALTLHHCFLDHQDNPMLDGRHPHRAVHTIGITPELAKQFGTTDLLILK